MKPAAIGRRLYQSTLRTLARPDLRVNAAVTDHFNDLLQRQAELDLDGAVLVLDRT